jgi:pimeloyl-ACP methyl ester carboxylesterase
MKALKWILIALVVLLGVGMVAFTIWAYTPLGPGEEAMAALQSDAAVTVITDPWLTFAPTGATPTTGFVFYPGGRVDPRSYAPAARAIAEEGYLVVTPMPFNLAVFAADRAKRVVAAYPEITHWALGGHSLGGAMAASYLYNTGTNEDGLALWASYPAGNDNLTDRTIPVASIYGTNDGVATPDDVLAGRPLLPPDTVFVPIEGGNHAQFGDYGPQPGDNPATISSAEQQARAVAATVEVLRRLDADSAKASSPACDQGVGAQLRGARSLIDRSAKY